MLLGTLLLLGAMPVHGAPRDCPRAQLHGWFDLAPQVRHSTVPRSPRAESRGPRLHEWFDLAPQGRVLPEARSGPPAALATSGLPPVVASVGFGGQLPMASGAAPSPLGAALAQEQRGEDAQAVAALEELVRAEPTAALPRLELARLLLKQGRQLDLAELHADVARALAPENPRAHFLWAQVCEERGRRVQARAALEVALALRPDYQDAQYRLAGLLFSEADYAGASALYRRYLEARPEATGARLQLADALDRGGHPEQAERELRALLAAAPAQPVAVRRLAELLERGGRAREAAKLKSSADQPPRKLRALKPSKR